MPRLILILLIGLLPGCGVSVSEYIYSHPYVEDQKLEGFTLEDENYRLLVRATNDFLVSRDEVTRDLSDEYYYMPFYMAREQPGPRNRDVFFIEILIHSFDEQISLDPRGFTLEMKGVRYHGIVYGPVKRYSRERSAENGFVPLCDFRVRDGKSEVIWGHVDTFNPIYPTDSGKIIQLQPKNESCFAIKFNTPPPQPEVTFSLSLDGLKIKPLPKRILFNKETASWTHP